MNYNLLIDIGNSNIKTAKSVNDNISSVKISQYSDSAFINILSNLDKIYPQNFTCIGVSLLDLKLKNKIAEILKNKFDAPTLFISLDLKLPLKFNYSKTLGADRICSAVSAFIKYNNKKNILIIDLGTATTFNLIHNGTFTGGLISVGMHTSVKALAQNTTLPLVSFRKVPELINDNTKDNIIAGAYYQNYFTVENVIKELRKKYKDLFVIATGGMSKHLIGRTALIDTLEPNLVLEGINNILNFNTGNS